MLNLKRVLFNILLVFILSSCQSNNELSEPVILLSQINNFVVDGSYEEWQSKGEIPLFCNQTGKIPQKEDLSAFFKFAYNSQGLGFYFNVTDDKKFVDTIYPWNGDAIEIFIAPNKGSKNILQFSISLSFNQEGVPNIRIDDRRIDAADSARVFIKGQRSGNITEMEAQLIIPWWSGEEIDNESFAIQVYIDDSDKKRDPDKNRLTWFNNNYSSETSLTYFPVKLSPTVEYFPNSTSRVKIIDDSILIMNAVGMGRGDKLSVYVSSDGQPSQLFDKTIRNDSALSCIMTKYNLDFENDEIYVFQNENCIAFHDLILAPREYVNIEPTKFHDKIRRFKSEDRANFPFPNSTLFIGSSSIRKWKSVERDFPELEIIHRGFGGSNSAHVLEYINDIVLPYNASTIVYYEGDNDIAERIGIDSIIQNISSFIEMVHFKKPETKIFILSPKPAIVRLKYYETYKKLHSRLENLAKNSERVIYVDVASPMFLSNGNLDTSLFIEDNLHMNERGYEIWTKVLRKSMGLEELRINE